MVPSSAIIVDDHERFRRALCEFVECEVGLDIVGEGSDGLQALELTSTLHPDFVLMDMCMPNMSGAEAAVAIKTADPAPRVLLYSGDTAEVDRARRQRVADLCLAKDQLFDELETWVTSTSAREVQP